MSAITSVPAAPIFLFFSAAFCAGLALYALKQRRDAFTANFIGLMLVSSVYALGYGAELLSSDLEGMKWMLRIQYLGIPFISVAWIGMAWGYLDSRGLPRRYLVVMMSWCLAVLVVFQTNELHHLFYANLEYTHVDGMAIARISKGPLYWLHIAYLNCCIAVGVSLFFRAWRQSMRIYQLQSLCLLIGSFFPWGFHLFYLAGLSPYQIDLGPFGLAASGIFSAIAFFRHGVLEILPVARDLVFDGISEGVIVLDNLDQVADFNRAATRFVRGLDQQSIGQQLMDIDGGPPIAEPLTTPRANDPESGVSGFEITVGSGEEKRHYEIRLSPVKDRNGAILCRALLMMDVTEKKQLLEQLHKLAITDALTGVFNRRQLDEQGQRVFLLTQRNGTPLSVGVIDIDHFKTINDSQGHQAGDDALRQISSLIGKRLRSTDILGRFGGDEFVVILPGAAISAAVELMRELNSSCRDTISVTLSIGVAEVGPGTPSFDTLLNEADAQLYRAKHAGRNQVMPRL